MKMNYTVLTSAIVAGLFVSSSAFAQDLAVGASAEASTEEASAEASAEADSEEAAEEEEAEEEAEEEEAEEEEEEAEEEEAEEEEEADEEEAEEEEEADEEGSDTEGWFRIDMDAGGLQLWAGATHQVGSIGIASDMYVTSAGIAEFDIGLSLPVSESITLLPMVGISANFAVRDVQDLIPQFYLYGDFSPIYIELWSQMFLSAFDGGAGQDNWYNRFFALYSVSDAVALGPQIEMNYNFNGAGLNSLPFGGRMNLEYGKNNTFGMFVGYEPITAGQGPGGNALAGRLTFVRTW